MLINCQYGTKMMSAIMKCPYSAGVHKMGSTVLVSQHWLKLITKCAVSENIHTHPKESLQKILRRLGVSEAAFSKGHYVYEAKLEFPEGWKKGSNRKKNFHGSGMNIFWNNKMSTGNFLVQYPMTKILKILHWTWNHWNYETTSRTRNITLKVTSYQLAW